MDDATERRILSQNFVHFYAGDTWRITADTSLTYGLRWELHTVPDETQGLALLPVGGAEAVLDPNAVVDFAGAAAGRPFLNSDRNNFAPNIGVARQLTDKLVLRAGYSLNYVLDNNLTTVSNAVGNNEGLSQTVVLPGVGGTVSGGGLVPVEAPEFKIPRTARDGILADSTAALFTFDPDLRTPSVRQWNLGLQYQLLPDTAVEVRYVGNRGNDLLRGVDRNQLLLPDVFVEDFRRAQRNLAANGAPWLGEPLQIFPLLGLGASCSRGAFRTGFETVRSDSISAAFWLPTGSSSSTERVERGSVQRCRSATSIPIPTPSLATSSAITPFPSTTRSSWRFAGLGARGSPPSSTTPGVR